MADPTRTEQTATLDELVAESRFAMFTTSSGDGRLLSRPMTIQEVTDDHDFVFISQAGTEVAGQSNGRQVNLAIVGDSSWVSVSGTATVAEEPATKERLWNSANDAYTEGGWQNPDNVVIRVHADSAEYWDTPGAVGIVLDVVKAKLTGGKPTGGDHGTVDL